MLDILRKDGIAMTWQPMVGVADTVDYLLQRPVWGAHVCVYAKTQAPSIRDYPGPAACHHMDDVVAAPHFFEEALRHYPLARDYFGEEPLLYSMNAFWTQPSDQRYEDTHWWHRDGDDRKQLVMFVFGTDVLLDQGGAHLYQRGTHQISDAQLGRPMDKPPAECISIVIGRGGTVFFSDTSGLHMGRRPMLGRRLLLWARWGVTDPPASYVWDKLRPAPRDLLGDRYPSDPTLQRAVRLVVQ